MSTLTNKEIAIPSDIIFGRGANILLFIKSKPQIK